MVLDASISVVVPVYNSQASLPLLIERLEPVLTAISADFEVILVNDGSRDRSWEVISQLAGMHAWVRGIALMRSYGQHNALLCGIRAARHAVIVTLDDARSPSSTIHGGCGLRNTRGANWSGTCST